MGHSGNQRPSVAFVTLPRPAVGVARLFFRICFCNKISNSVCDWCWYWCWCRCCWLLLLVLMMVVTAAAGCFVGDGGDGWLLLVAAPCMSWSKSCPLACPLTRRLPVSSFRKTCLLAPSRKTCSLAPELAREHPRHRIPVASCLTSAR